MTNLVLTLHEGRRIRIGKDVWVTLLELGRGRRARLAFEAPKSVRIVREERLPLDQRYVGPHGPEGP